MEHVIDDILNECIESILRGENPENCLNKYPEYAKILQPLLQTAVIAREAAMASPSAEFKIALKNRLISDVNDAKIRPVRVNIIWRSAWFTGLAVLLALIVLISGTVVGASNSMPDSLLYGVKLTSERIWLGLHTSTMGKLEYSAQLANNRVAELIYELSKTNSDPADLDKAAARLDDSLTQIANLANISNSQSNAPAVNVSEIKDKEKAQLIQALALYAVNNSQILQNEMQTAPDEVKPQIESAINQTVASFDKAIKSIEDESASPAQ